MAQPILQRAKQGYRVFIHQDYDSAFIWNRATAGAPFSPTSDRLRRRRVSTILRHSFEEFNEYRRLSLLVC